MSEMIEMIVVEEPGAFEIAALLSDLWNTLLRVLKGRVDGLLAMKSDNPEAAKDFVMASHVYRFFHSIFFNGCLNPEIRGKLLDIIPRKYRRNVLLVQRLIEKEKTIWERLFQVLKSSNYVEVSLISIKYLQFLVNAKTFNKATTNKLHDLVYAIEEIAQKCYKEYKKLFEVFIESNKFKSQQIDVEEMEGAVFKGGLFPYDKSLLYCYKVTISSSKISMCTSNCKESNLANLIKIFRAEISSGGQIDEAVPKQKKRRLLIDEEVEQEGELSSGDQIDEEAVPKQKKRRLLIDEEVEQEGELSSGGPIEEVPINRRLLIDEEVEQEGELSSDVDLSSEDEQTDHVISDVDNSVIIKEINQVSKKKDDDSNEFVVGVLEGSDPFSSCDEGEARKTSVRQRRRRFRVKQEPQDKESNELSSQSAICDFFLAKVFDSTPNATDAVSQLKITKEKHPDIKYSKIIADAG